jgi:hypothetical protein
VHGWIKVRIGASRKETEGRERDRLEQGQVGRGMKEKERGKVEERGKERKEGKLGEKQGWALREGDNEEEAGAEREETRWVE